MTQHGLGKILLAASSFLAAADNDTRLQAGDRPEFQPPSATTSFDADPNGRSLDTLTPPHPQNFTDKARDLSPVASPASPSSINIRVSEQEIISALHNPQLITATLDSLSKMPEEFMATPAILQALVKASLFWADHAETDYPHLLESQGIVDALVNALTSEVGGNYGYAKLYAALPESNRSVELTQLMRLNVIAHANALLDGRPAGSSELDRSDYVPSGLMTEDDFRDLVNSRRQPLDNEMKLKLIRFLNFNEATTSSLVEDIGFSTTDALAYLAPSEFSPTMTTTVSELLKNDATLCAQVMRARPVLLNNPAFMAVGFEALSRDITLVPEELTSLQSEVMRREAAQIFLSDPSRRDLIAAEIQENLLNVTKYPSLVLEWPEIQHATRTSITNTVKSKFLFGGDPKRGSAGVPLRDVVNKVLRDVPDVVVLIRTAQDFDCCQGLLPQILACNPGAAVDLSRFVLKSSHSALPAHYATVSALTALNISGIRHFDNAAEIIINRFHASDGITQKLLLSLPAMSERFRNGRNSFLSNPALDPRPVCVVVMTTPAADPQGAYREDDFVCSANVIDSLTSFYRVVYYESRQSGMLAEHIAETYNKLGKKVELLILAGHGGELGLQLDAASNPSAFLRHEDVAGLQKAREALADNCKIILASCAAAKRFGGNPSLAEELHEVFPFTTVYGPSDPTGVDFIFQTSGEFQEIAYNTADRIVLLPYCSEPVVEKSQDRFVSPLVRAVRLSFNNPEYTGMIGTGGLLAGAYLFIRRHLRRRKENEQVVDNSPVAPALTDLEDSPGGRSIAP